MFTYQISPESSDQIPTMISIRISGQTITIYSRGTRDQFSQEFQPFMLAVWDLDSCMRAYSTKSKGKIKNVSEEDEAHKELHSNEPYEVDVFHHHFKHQKQITLKNLKRLLDYLKDCESTKKLPTGETFLTHTIRKDILAKFKLYLENHHGKDNGLQSNINYLTSNDRNCSQLPLRVTSPTIFQHESFLRSPDAMCKQIAAPFSTTPSSYASGAAIALSVFAFGLFAMKKFKTKTIQVEKNFNQHLLR